MAYALSLSGLLTTFRHHFVQRPHAQCKFNCFNPTARACYVTFARQCNQDAIQQCTCACVMAERRCSAHADVEQRNVDSGWRMLYHCLVC